MLSRECFKLRLAVPMRPPTLKVKSPKLFYTVDSRYLEFQGTLWNTSRYPYLNISDLQNWGKTNSINHI